MIANPLPYHFRLKQLLTVVLIGLLPLFFFGGPDWASGPLYRSAWNLGHVIFFALLTWLLQLYLGTGGWRQWLVISGLVLFAGMGLEYLQSFVERQVDWGDILRNLIGAWLVLAWRSPASAGRARVGIWVARMAATLLLLLELVAVAGVALQQYHIDRQLPLLADLETPEAIRHWSGDVRYSREHSADGGYSLAIHLGTGRYSGVSLNNMPGDWRGYERLSFRLYNPGPGPLALTLRLNDQQHDRGPGLYHDRFNSHFVARPGWHHYRFDLAEVQAAPASRGMDMNKMRRLGLFTTRLEKPRTVYLDDLRLE